MKKIIYLILIFFMALSFTSCGEKEQEVPTEPLVDFNFNYVYIKNNAKLSTSSGSFDVFKYNNYKFAAYRSYSTSGALEIMPYNKFNDVTYADTLNGALTNVTCINDIRKIKLIYKTDAEALLRYGNNTDKVNSKSIGVASSYQTIELSISDANYFSVEAISDSFYLKEITISFTDKNLDEDSLTKYDNIRINPYQKISSPKNLDTVSLPVKYEYVNNKLNINEFKTYTYYDMEYIIEHPSIASEAACIDPVDVSNYYIAFNAFPVNYTYKEDYDDIYYLFQNKTRCVSRYTRTDGYAVSVPYNVGSNGKPLYYEFDIALNQTYSTGSRGMGRVVMWDYGFSTEGYDLSPVAVYTDDHYYTFQEFNNLGSFSKRFDAENPITFRTFNSTTINL